MNRTMFNLTTTLSVVALLIPMHLAGQISAGAAKGSDTATQAAAIIVNVSGLACSSAEGEPGFDATSWSIGASSSITSSGHEGAPSLQPLTIVKPFDECSPMLLGDYLQGGKFFTLSLTQGQLSSDGKLTKTLIVQLRGAQFAGYVLGGSTQAGPAENWTVAYQQICITNYANGVKACYDSKTGR